MITEYEIIQAGCPDDLVKAINLKLKQGWCLSGDLTVYAYFLHDRFQDWLIQPITRQVCDE